jgi:hypothetical protein
MIWALLAILGVPIWLVLGALGFALYNRHRFKNAPGTFRLKLRKESGTYEGIGDKWPKPSSYALWVHDVLLVHKGLGLVPTTAIGMAAMESSGQSADPEEVKGLGDNPTILRFRLDDESIIQMAVPGDAREIAQGPFTANENSTG